MLPSGFINPFRIWSNLPAQAQPRADLRFAEGSETVRGNAEAFHVRRSVILGIALLATLAACRQSDRLEPVGEQRVAIERQTCEDHGGRFGKAGSSGLLACFETPRDAGKSCSRSTQCESACLARSQTCAPVKPLFGCNEILNEAGTRQTQCLD
jgi:hypothetical protein